MTTERKFFVGGNWKMNGTTRTIDCIIDNLNQHCANVNADVVVAPPFPYLSYVKSKLSPNILVSAQNCYSYTTQELYDFYCRDAFFRIVHPIEAQEQEPKGAFTGEVSAGMLVDLGIPWVIIGHSERRHVFGETHDLLKQKILAAMSTGLSIIYCVGETLEERETDRTQNVVCLQLETILTASPDWTRVVIAYEPVWAIGTGKTASSEQAQEMHAMIRKYIRVSKEKQFYNPDPKIAALLPPSILLSLRVIYGGSVTAENCKELAKMPDIDGFLVGGASLKPDFVEIVKARG